MGVAQDLWDRQIANYVPALWPVNATSSAYEASRVVKASPGTMFGFSGYNSKTAAQFILVFDAAALPADGVAPVMIVPAAAADSFWADAGEWGRFFSTGIVVCNSSTGPTKTIGAADCWFDVQYA